MFWTKKFKKRFWMKIVYSSKNQNIVFFGEKKNVIISHHPITTEQKKEKRKSLISWTKFNLRIFVEKKTKVTNLWIPRENRFFFDFFWFFTETVVFSMKLMIGKFSPSHSWWKKNKYLKNNFLKCHSLHKKEEK